MWGITVKKSANVAHALVRAVSRLLSTHSSFVILLDIKRRDESRRGTQSACGTLTERSVEQVLPSRDIDFPADVRVGPTVQQCAPDATIALVASDAQPIDHRHASR